MTHVMGYTLSPPSGAQDIFSTRSRKNWRAQSLCEARRTIAQPEGSAAAASATFTKSPKRNGATPARHAPAAPTKRASHAQPLNRISAEPIIMAAAAVENRLSQPRSASSPVVNAASGYDSRYPVVGLVIR